MAGALEQHTRVCYLDHAATSWPKPRAVGEAMVRTMTAAGGNPGRAGHLLSLRAAECVYRARECAAAFFGSQSPENVLFYPNATYAINAVLHGLLRGGREPVHVLVSEMEHNAVIRPLYALEQAGNIVWETYPVFRGRSGMLSRVEILSQIRARLRRNTALVCACHVSNVCGARLPIAQIGAMCREMRVPFLVDASQSAGIYDIDLRRDNIDYLCTAGHKALLGPQGSGLLLIGDGAPVLSSFVQGGNGVASLSAAMPELLPEAMEAGTLAVPAIAGLEAGMRYLSAIGIDTVRGECHMLYARLREMLLSLPGVHLCQGMLTEGTALSFTVDGISCMQCAERLSDAGICVRAGFHCAPLPHRAFGTGEDGTVRVSVGHGSTRRDAERFYREMRRITGGS